MLIDSIQKGGPHHAQTLNPKPFYHAMFCQTHWPRGASNWAKNPKRGGTRWDPKEKRAG